MEEKTREDKRREKKRREENSGGEISVKDKSDNLIRIFEMVTMQINL